MFMHPVIYIRIYVSKNTSKCMFFLYLMLYARAAAGASDTGIFSTVYWGAKADDVILSPKYVRWRQRQVQAPVLRSNQFALRGQSRTSSSANRHLNNTTFY